MRPHHKRIALCTFLSSRWGIKGLSNNIRHTPSAAVHNILLGWWDCWKCWWGQGLGLRSVPDSHSDRNPAGPPDVFISAGGGVVLASGKLWDARSPLHKPLLWSKNFCFVCAKHFLFLHAWPPFWWGKNPRVACIATIAAVLSASIPWPLYLYLTRNFGLRARHWGRGCSFLLPHYMLCCWCSIFLASWVCPLKRTWCRSSPLHSSHSPATFPPPPSCSSPCFGLPISYVAQASEWHPSYINPAFFGGANTCRWASALARLSLLQHIWREASISRTEV